MAHKDAVHNAAWGGFINLRLNTSELEAYDGWYIIQSDNIFQFLDNLVTSGFKYGLTFDANHDTYIATLTAAGESLIGLVDRYCLTARAPSMHKATGLLLYKHMVCLEGNWGSWLPSTDRWRIG